MVALVLRSRFSVKAVGPENLTRLYLTQFDCNPQRLERRTLPWRTWRRGLKNMAATFRHLPGVWCLATGLATTNDRAPM